MKKKRIDLSKQYPKYFATTGRKENMAELTEEDQEILDKLEEKLEKLEELEAQEEEEEEESSASSEEEENNASDEEEEDHSAQATAQASASSDDKRVAKLEAKLDKVLALLDSSPGAEHTSVDNGAQAEGGGKKTATNTYATSVDAELEKFFK